MPRLLAGRQRLVLARLLGNGIAQAMCALGLAWMIRTVVDHVLLGQTSVEFGKLVWEIGGAFAFVVVMALLRGRERVDRDILAQTHAHRLRRALYARLNATPAADLAGMRHGAILLRFLGDLTAITQWIGMGLARLGVAALTVVITLAVVAAQWPLMALAVGGVLLGGAAAVFAIGRWMDGAVNRARRRRSIVANNITEKLSALSVVRAFGQAERERSRLLRQSRRLRRALIDRSRAIGTINAIAEATGTVATLVALLVGLLAVARSQASAGAVVGMMTLTSMLAAPSRDLGKVYEYWRRAKISQSKIAGFLAGFRSGSDDGAPSLVSVGDQKGGRLELVGVGHGGTFTDLSLVIEAGQRVAVTGGAGAGKSQLAHVLAGLVTPAEGRVLLDNQDMATCLQESLRAAIGVVSADLPLLRGSVDSNLRYAWPDAPPSAIDRVLVLSGIDNLLPRLPAGLATRVAEGGRNLSVGQRQRVALGRALLRQPRLLVIDDADTTGDNDFRGVLLGLLKDFEGTIVTVTQDPLLIEAHDFQLRLQDGAVQLIRPLRQEIRQGQPDHPRDRSRDGDRKIVSL